MSGRRAIILIGLVLILFPCLAVGGVSATPFSFTPDGNLLIDTAFTTHGVFFCGAAPICSGSGTNSVVLSSGTATATITFSGVTTELLVGPSGAHVVLGEFHTFASGTGLIFDHPLLPFVANILSFTLTIDQSSPVPGSVSAFWNFGLTGNLQDSTANHPETPIGPQPNGIHYRGIGFEIEPWPFNLPSSGDLEIGARVGLTPEPATLLLFGTTAAGLGLVRWFRRGRQHAA